MTEQATAVPIPQAQPRLSAAWAGLRPHLPALAFLALMALAYWHRIDTWHIDDDEEGYLYAAWRISRGELPYRDFLTPQLPAFLFPGGLWIALFGPEAIVLRAWSAVLMLIAGFATYLSGRRLFGAVGGLVAMVVLLLSDDIFPLARAWRPEATMLALAMLAFYAFVRADEAERRRGYVIASLLFGASLLAKLFGFLPWAGVGAYVVFDLLTRGRPPRRAVGDLLALSIPGALLVAIVMGGFQLLTPETYHAVLEHQLRQNAELSRMVVLANALDFYWRALSWHAPLLAFVPLGIYGGWRLAGRRSLVVPWVLPTVLAFTLLSRTLFARHLVYLLPFLSLLVGAAVAWLLTRLVDVKPRVRALVAVTLLATVALPFVFDIVEDYSREEVGTARLGALVQALTPVGSRIVADYPGIAFYGDRATTFSGAGLSEGAAESGQITGEQLWQEMVAGDVRLVLIDQETQNGQLKDLVDFDLWQAKVLQDYRRLGKFYRQYQPLDVYRHKDDPGLGLDFGPLALEAAPVDRATVEAGGTVDVSAVLHADERPDKAYTAFLHLVGPDGETWATGDTFMNNALFRGSEEWEPDEVVLVPMSVTVPPGTPPGTYALRFGLYDAGSGERLAADRADGRRADEWDIGTVAVVPPARPAGGSALGVGSVGPYVLLGPEPPGSTTAGSRLRVASAWRTSGSPGADHRLKISILGPNRVPWGEVTVAPGGPSWPTSQWRAGEVVTNVVYLPVDPRAKGGPAEVYATWLDTGGQPLGDPLYLGSYAVAALPPMSTAVPAIAHSLSARLGNSVALLGSSLGEVAAPGGTLDFDLYWRADAVTATQHTVLVHVLDASGAVVAQADGKPERSTSSWRPGEVITDPHTLTLPADLPPGDYTVLAGLYDASDPAYPRLAAKVDGVARDDGRVPLGVVRVGEGP
jgi:4-amino-4-deoxy-L-arabinose transferase-like glycosyltransferase